MRALIGGGWRGISSVVPRMFNKPSAKGALTDRLRQVAERKTQAFQEPAPPPRKTTERAERRQVFREGYVILPSGQKLRVAIKNLSSTGARIEFLGQSELTDEVLLLAPMLELRQRARVVWQLNGAAGLHFIQR
jgi:hypothetical protein